jgi:hypothetical protein
MDNVKRKPHGKKTGAGGNQIKIRVKEPKGRKELWQI